MALSKKTQSPLTQSMILRHLGTCSQKLNEERSVWLAYFDQAIDILKKQSSVPNAQLGLTQFQKATCLVNSALIELKSKMVTNLTDHDRFLLIKNYLSPANQSATIAQKLYPNQSANDFLLMELKLLLWLLSSDFQIEPIEQQLQASYSRIISNKKQLLATQQADILLYAMIKKVMVLRSEGKNKVADEVAKQMLNVESTNRELNLEVKLQYAATKIQLITKPSEFLSLEKFLTNCIEEVESFRTKNVEQESFFQPQAYFSRRLSAYELLLELYDKNNQIEKMLITIDQMKARAFKDMIGNGGVKYPLLNLQNVQANLKQRNACSVEYFIGQSGVWLFTITPEKVIKKKIDCTSSELIDHVKRTITGYTNSKLFRHYKSNSSRTNKY